MKKRKKTEEFFNFQLCLAFFRPKILTSLENRKSAKKLKSFSTSNFVWRFFALVPALLLFGISYSPLWWMWYSSIFHPVSPVSTDFNSSCHCSLLVMCLAVCRVPQTDGMYCTPIQPHFPCAVTAFLTPPPPSPRCVVLFGLGRCQATNRHCNVHRG